MGKNAGNGIYIGKRCVKVLKTRFKATRAKGKMIQKLGRSGVNTAVWARTAGLSGMLYGAEITGISNSMLKRQRSVIAAASSAPGASNCPLTSLWLHDCVSGKLDPSFAAHELPIAQYAKACYEGWIPRDSLQTAFEQARTALSKTM